MQEKRSNKYEKIEPEKEEQVEETQEVEKDYSKLKKILFILLIIIIIFLTYTMAIEPKNFIVKEYKVESSLIPESFHGLKIVQFSDIHYGTTINKKELERIVKLINKQKPDIIVFTGDLIDKNISINDTIQDEITSSLNKLEATLYKYAIYGNDDDEKHYKDIMEKSNFKLLKNSSTLLYLDGEIPIEITGFDPIESNPNYTILTNKIDEVDTTNLYKIILAHDPDTIDKISIYNPNLVLTGSTLGGSINIIKPLFTNNSNHIKDYEKIDGIDLYISNGLGTSGINMRLNNLPSISLYRLYSINE